MRPIYQSKVNLTVKYYKINKTRVTKIVYLCDLENKEKDIYDKNSTSLQRHSDLKILEINTGGNKNSLLAAN